MTIDFHKLDRTALALQPFADGLLTGNRNRADVPLLELPIRWSEFGRHWEQVFEQAGGTLPRILETGAALVDQLWESRGAWCGARSYAAIEDWLRRHTLPLGAYRPRLTLKSLLFVTAVHNWWWWQRTGEQVASRHARPGSAADPGADRREREQALRRTLVSLDVSDPQLLVAGPALEQQLKRDVDHFLDWLEHAEAEPQRGPLQLGDLVAMHVMAVPLGSVFSGAARPQRGELQTRLERLQTLSPISRLAALGTPERPLLTSTMNRPWVGIELLLTDPAAAGIRQSLASSLGAHAVQSDPRATVEVLDVFRRLQELAGDVETVFGEGVQTFLAQVLHASFSAGTDERRRAAVVGREGAPGASLSERADESLQRVWQSWGHHDPQRGSLAQWCGRLARWCEAKAQARRSAVPLEVEWLWRELAQSVLPRWVTGDAAAILCWGRWIRGYLEGPEESQYVPRLVLARHACRQSLEQLVSSWSIAVPRALRRAAARSGDGRMAAELQELQATLQALPAYRKLVREEFNLSVGSGPRERPPEASRPTADVPVNPGVKAYRY